MNNWRKFWELSAADRGAFVQAMLLLLVVRAALRVISFDRCRTVLERLSPERDVEAATPAEDLRRARVIGALVQAAGRHGPAAANCLRESLVLWFMLRRRGIPSRIRIGVRKAAQTIEAHAWVVCGACVLNDTSDVDGRFTAFEQTVGGI